MMEKIIIIGCGGHAKSVVDIIERTGQYEIAGFVDRERNPEFEYRGYRILAADGELDMLYRCGIRYAAVGIGYMGVGDLRKRIYASLKKAGLKLPVLMDPSASVARDVQIGEGTVIGKMAVLNAGARVGKMSIINTGAVVEHECNVKDFTHIAVRAVLCGDVTIGENTFIGAGATVIQGCHIGADVLVGAGSLVLNDIGKAQKRVGIIK